MVCQFSLRVVMCVCCIWLSMCPLDEGPLITQKQNRWTYIFILYDKAHVPHIWWVSPSVISCCWKLNYGEHVRLVITCFQLEPTQSNKKNTSLHTKTKLSYCVLIINIHKPILWKQRVIYLYLWYLKCIIVILTECASFRYMHVHLCFTEKEEEQCSGLSGNNHSGHWRTYRPMSSQIRTGYTEGRPLQGSTGKWSSVDNSTGDKATDLGTWYQ